jgi:nucleoside 2-deoxyribosyltransferase
MAPVRGGRSVRVYLAGGLHSGWQDEVKELAPDIDWIDPRDPEFQDTKHLAITAHRELTAIDGCHAVLFHYEGVYCHHGSATEIGYAVAGGTPVYMVTNRNTRIVAWWLGVVDADEPFRDFESAIDAIRNDDLDGIRGLDRWLAHGDERYDALREDG